MARARQYPTDWNCRNKMCWTAYDSNFQLVLSIVRAVECMCESVTCCSNGKFLCLSLSLSMVRRIHNFSMPYRVVRVQLIEFIAVKRHLQRGAQTIERPSSIEQHTPERLLVAKSSIHSCCFSLTFLASHQTELVGLESIAWFFCIFLLW